MGKRVRDAVAEDPSDNRKGLKRTRLEDKEQKQSSRPLTAEPITSARQLQRLLSHYDDIAQLRNGIQSFRIFIESISSKETSGTELLKLRPILREYLESQISKNEWEEEAVYMGNIMQAWSLASQSNNNSLLSAIPSVLGLLLRAMSSIKEFKLYGIRLCRTLVQHAQLTLIHRGLSATYEFVLAPHLRLLTEVVSFDNGSQAKAVYTHREFTFRSLGKHLNWSTATGKPGQGKKKQSIREIAIGYLLANFKYQNVAAKTDLVEQRSIISALLTNIREDPPKVVVETLNVLKEHFVLDSGVQRSAKSRLLTSWALSRFATLYSYTATFSGDDSKTVDTIAHEFLTFVCTKRQHGVLLPESGWYPAGGDLNEGNSMGTDVRSLRGLDLRHIDSTISYSDDSRYQDRVPVRNTTLSTFIQGLRPYANTLQSELLLAIFKAAPELVADYFFNSRSFSFEPKLTATWIGYSAFLFLTVQLPVPASCGRRDGFSTRPPPTSVVIESILPQPLNQKVLTKCLNQKTKLVRFFAIRLLCVAFQKLEIVLDVFRTAFSEGSALWEHASERLIQEFCRRCPRMKDIITVFRSTEERDFLQREAVARLLASYYRVTPEMAVNEKFDVSVALANALKRIGVKGKGEKGVADEECTEGGDNGDSDIIADSEGDIRMRMIELEHLLFIAQCSPSIRWWNKPESLPLTAFTSLLKLLVEALPIAPLSQIKGLLQSIISRTQHLQQETSGSSLGALIKSLRPGDDGKLDEAILQFLDNSIVRYARSSIKYYDEFVLLVSEEYDEPTGVVEVQPVSLLVITLVEQWQFLDASKSTSPKDRKLVAEWLIRYLESSAEIGENRIILIKLSERLANTTKSDQQLQCLFGNCGSVLKGLHSDSDVADAASGSTDKQIDRVPEIERSVSSDLGSIGPMTPMSYQDPIQKPDKRRGDSVDKVVTNWLSSEDGLVNPVTVIESNCAGFVIMGLTSPDRTVRMTALGIVETLIAKLAASNYSEKDEVKFLLRGLVHTAKMAIDQHRLPTPLAVFAAKALIVQTDPLHCLYPKVNHFLLQGPTWETSKVPLFHTVLLHEPNEDDSYYKEVAWMIDNLKIGLRTPDDLNIYRRNHYFEHLLSMYWSPYLPEQLKVEISQVLFQAADIDGGGATLITRAGIVDWIDLVKDPPLKRLAKAFYDNSTLGHVDAWSNGSMAERVRMMEEAYRRRT